MERPTEKITDDILVLKACNRDGVFIKTVFFKYIPVAKFNAHSLAERRIAAVELVSLALRLVVLHDINSDRRIGIYTNNHVKSAGDIAFYMLSRWGDSENLYNELMAKFNVNYHPGYDIDELQDQSRRCWAGSTIRMSNL